MDGIAHGHRISALDASFLHLERAGARLHVASVTVFDGPAPPYDELRELIESRLHRVPRFRQRLADVPLQQGRPVWVDDPHFNLRYHLRHAGLPAPGSEEQLKNLAGRLFAQRLDRTKPLWELWLVDGLRGRHASRSCPRATTHWSTASRRSTSRRSSSTPSPAPRRARARSGQAAGRRGRCRAPHSC